MRTYTTQSGDTWDKIAYAVYGDELRADQIMKEPANMPLLDIMVFPDGKTVYVPTIPDEEDYAADLPDWRK